MCALAYRCKTICKSAYQLLASVGTHCREPPPRLPYLPTLSPEQYCFFSHARGAPHTRINLPHFNCLYRRLKSTVHLLLALLSTFLCKAYAYAPLPHWALQYSFNIPRRNIPLKGSFTIFFVF